MLRKTLLALGCALAVSWAADQASAQVPTSPTQGYPWGYANSAPDYNRFYHYPYVYYPQNFWGTEYYQSSNNLYYRYPPEMRVPVYNRDWFNYYPEGRRYHRGHQFILDVF